MTPFPLRHWKAGWLASGLLAAGWLTSSCNDRPDLKVTPGPIRINVEFSGVVFEVGEAGRQPVAGAEVTWCDAASCREDATVLTGPQGTFALTARDAAGRAFLRVRKDGYRLEYSTYIRDTQTALLDIEIRRVPPLTSLTGLVFESTASGIVPLAGVKVWLCTDTSCMDGWEATTGTDGRYRQDFGGWWGTVEVQIIHRGFQRYGQVVDAFGATTHDVRLVRGGQP